LLEAKEEIRIPTQVLLEVQAVVVREETPALLVLEDQVHQDKAMLVVPRLAPALATQQAAVEGEQQQ
jgi:hypothetical protein